MDGRVALVTGGANGLGLAIAQRLSEEGAAVYLVDRDPSALGAAKEAFDPDARVGVANCDVRDGAEVDRAVRGAVELFGGLDVLVNAAGTSTSANVADLSESEWDLVLDVNLKGTFLFCRAAIPALRKSGTGAIVNIASREGKRPTPGFAHYGASKAAVISLTRSIASELAPDVRANAVCPGLVRTQLVMQHVGRDAEARGVDPEIVLSELAAEIPLGRLQTASSIASAVVFLASSDAADITGQALSVDGGSVMY